MEKIATEYGIDMPGLILWLCIGLAIYISTIGSLYRNEEYRGLHWSRRRLREIAALLVIVPLGVVSLVIAPYFMKECLGAPESEEEQDPEDIEMVAIGVMMDQVVLSGNEEDCRSAMASLKSRKPGSVVEAFECLNRWSQNYSASRLAMDSIFDPKGSHIATYVLGDDAYEITEAA